MSFAAVTWAVQQELKDPKEKLLLVVLAHCLNSTTGKCCPSRDLLMRMACIANSNTLTAKLNSLSEKGVIEISKKIGASNQYKFLTSFNSEAPSAVKYLQDCTAFTTESGTPFTTEAPPPSALKVEYRSNKELNKEITTAVGDNSKEDLFVEQERPQIPNKPRQAKVHNFDLKELPEDWRIYCEQVRPDLDPVRTFITFKAYYGSGKGSGVRRGDKGWNQSWQGWVRREQGFPAAKPAQQPQTSRNEPWLNNPDYYSMDVK